MVRLYITDREHLITDREHLIKGSPHRAAYIAQLLGDKIVTTKEYPWGVPSHFDENTISKYKAIESIKKS